MMPKKLKVEDQKLKIEWDDGSKDEIGLRYLRDQCPCANCKGEHILFKKIDPIKVYSDEEKKYKIVRMEIQGKYAVQIFWADGHNTGIYPWDYLKELAQTESENKNHDYKPLL
jgi:DUF971 family protein